MTPWFETTSGDLRWSALMISDSFRRFETISAFQPPKSWSLDKQWRVSTNSQRIRGASNSIVGSWCCNFAAAGLTNVMHEFMKKGVAKYMFDWHWLAIFQDLEGNEMRPMAPWFLIVNHDEPSNDQSFSADGIMGKVSSSGSYATLRGSADEKKFLKSSKGSPTYLTWDGPEIFQWLVELPTTGEVGIDMNWLGLCRKSSRRESHDCRRDGGPRWGSKRPLNESSWSSCTTSLGSFVWASIAEPFTQQHTKSNKIPAKIPRQQAVTGRDQSRGHTEGSCGLMQWEFWCNAEKHG